MPESTLVPELVRRQRARLRALAGDAALVETEGGATVEVDRLSLLLSAVAPIPGGSGGGGFGGRVVCEAGDTPERRAARRRAHEAEHGPIGHSERGLKVVVTDKRSGATAARTADRPAPPEPPPNPLYGYVPPDGGYRLGDVVPDDERVVTPPLGYVSPWNRSGSAGRAGSGPRLRTSGAEYARAFRNYLRTGQDDRDGTLRAALGEGVGTDGGFLVPEGFRVRLVERMKAFGGLARVAEEITTKTGNNLPWAVIDDTGNEGGIVSEGGAFSLGSDFVFGSRNLTAYRYAAGGGAQTPVRVPWELLQDAALPIESLVARLLGERLGRVEARHFARGGAVGAPEGLLYNVTGHAIAGLVPTYDELVDLTHAVDPAYREAQNCGWIMNDNSLREVKKIKDLDGDPIFRPGLTWTNEAERPTPEQLRLMQSPMLLGYPVTIDQSFPNIAVGTTPWCAFGDFRQAYVVRRVREVFVVVNPWTRASNGQVEYSAFSRADGAVQDPDAYAVLLGPAA